MIRKLSKFWSTYLIRSLLAGCVIALGLPVSATHIVGGEIYLEPYPNNTMKVGMNLYTDDIEGLLGAIDDQVTLACYNKATNRLVISWNLRREPFSLLRPRDTNCTAANFRTRLTTYSVLTPFNPNIFNDQAGYYVSWARCCRNNAIVNITNPGDAGSVFYLEFPGVGSGPGMVSRFNTTPRFTTPTADFGCIDNLFKMDFGAFDTDGDSLSYELTTPINGPTNPDMPDPGVAGPRPYTSITWSRGYSADNSIPGRPALAVDQRGQLTVRATLPGLYVFGLTVTEWRRGVAIGQVRRDFQFTIRDCGFNPPPRSSIQLPEQPLVPTQRSRFDTLTVRYTDTNACVKIALYGFKPGNQISIREDPINYKTPLIRFLPSTGTIRQVTDSLYINICSAKCSPDTLPLYLTRLIASVKGCPIAANDTINLALRILPAPFLDSLKITLSGPTQIATSGLDTLQFNASASAGNNPNPISLFADFNRKDSATLALVGNRAPSFYGLSFRARQAIGEVSSAFKWQVDCQAYERFGGKTLQLWVKARTEDDCRKTAKDSVLVYLTLTPIPTQASILPINVLLANGLPANRVFSLPSLNFACSSNDVKIDIYNRWGNLVYHAEDKEFAWSSENVAEGVYYYYLHYGKFTYKGWITVIR